MVRIRSSFAALLCAAALPVQALTVFACAPEWAALTRVLAPDARIHTATHARQDPHHIEARPSLIAQLRSADIAVCTGAALEAGWLPMLQERAGNRKVQDGAPGMFYAADHAALIDVQTAPGFVTPFDGDVHAQGNPHLHADPRRVLEVSQALAQQLQTVLPAQAAAIGQRAQQFQTQWMARIVDWERRAAPLKGQRVAAQHASFGYLWRWLGVEVAADLEPKPGMAPTPAHLQKLLSALRDKPPAAVVITSYHDPRAARWLVGQLGDKVPLLALPATVEDPAAPDALALWFEQLLQALLKSPAATR